MTDIAFSVLKVRPVAALEEGPSADRIRELVACILDHSVRMAKQDYVTISLDASPQDGTLVERMAQAILDGFDEAGLVVVDFCHPRIVANYAVPEWILYRALAIVRLKMSDSMRIFVYLETLPVAGERLFGLVPELQSASDIQFVDIDGHVLGGDLEQAVVQARIQAFASDHKSSVAANLTRRFTRWRGVFSRPEVPRERYFKYQYTLTTETALGELAQLISAYIIENDVDAVVYLDHAHPGWLEPAVGEAAATVGIPWASSLHLEAADVDIDEALRPIVEQVRRGLADEAVHTLVLIPAYHEGTTHTEIESQLLRFGRREFSLLAVIVDSQLAKKYESISSWHGAINLPRGRRMVRLDYFIEAPIETLAQSDWAVIAAKTLGDVHGMSTEDPDASPVGMWSLLADYDTGPEEPVPNGRAPVRWYPRLESLSEWDAHWVLLLMVNRVCRQLSREREQLLLVIPDERNATKRLIEHAERVEGVRSLALTRDEIAGTTPINDRAVQLVDDYSRMVIVAVDELRRTGSTLAAISARVKELRGRSCDATATILAAPTTSGGVANAEDVSLFTWKPYLTGESP